MLAEVSAARVAFESKMQESEQSIVLLRAELDEVKQDSFNNEQGWWTAHIEFEEEAAACVEAKQEMDELSQAMAQMRGSHDVSSGSLLPPEPAPVAAETMSVLERAQVEIAKLSSLLQAPVGRPSGETPAPVVSTVYGGSSGSGTNTAAPQGGTASSNPGVVVSTRPGALS